MDKDIEKSLSLRVHFILYVSDQEASTRFYAETLNSTPRLHVPGMTEFDLANGSVLGLMPENGIKKLLGDKISHPHIANGIPRAELYLLVDDPQPFLERALQAGATELSPFAKRSWGHYVAYCADRDTHILAFAAEK